MDENKLNKEYGTVHLSGTYMLYHLTQTAVGKDITLHVSANNPALLLYQEGNEPFSLKNKKIV
jgi:hypothetical protein